jgi:hypothetical protein
MARRRAKRKRLFGRFRATRSGVKSLTSSQLRQVLAKQLAGKFSPGVAIHLADSVYHCPTMTEVKAIVAASSTDRKKYIPGKHDCDDFAHRLKNDFIEAAYADGKRQKPICMGVVWGMLPKPHAINWVVCSDGKLYFIEPQDDSIFKPRPNDKAIFMMMA